jgi:glycosyltransferase involved in cell wall biosynthesis
VQQHNLEDKVELRFGWLEQATKLDLLANCLAVAYLPTDEDSYGYISLEASLSHKPIITTTDSGGVPEFVRNGVEGAIVAPDAEALAAAFDAFYFDKQAAQRMGTASWQRMAELNISEDNVIARLLGQEIGQETGGAKS